MLTEHLRELIECRTISDGEFFSQAEFDKLDAVLHKNYPLVFEKGEIIPLGNASFIRIPGKFADSPLVLMSHKDVVYEGKKKWKAPPYEGRIINGKMFGRGTFDCKASLCCIFEAAENLLSSGYVPDRDIYILSTSNEETGGNDAPDAVEYFRNKNIVPKLVLDEGGGTLSNPFPSKYKRFAMMGAVERSTARMVFDSDNADDIKKFTKALRKLRPGKYEITPEVQELLEGLGRYLAFPLGNIVASLSRSPKRATWILTHCGPDARSFCGTLCGFTKPNDYAISKLEEKLGELKNPLKIFVSGNYYNKIDDMAAEVVALSEKYNLKLKDTEMREADPPVSSGSYGFKLISETAKKTFDNVAALPYPILGRTDSRYFVGYAENVIRYLPVEISLFQMMKFHCPNENVYVKSLEPAVRYYENLIRSINR